MLAERLARALAARGIHYGWVMVALVFAYGVASSGAMSIPSVLLLPISQEFGWTLGEISGPLALRFALFGLVAPFAGALMLRHGPRRVVLASATLLVVGLLLMLAMGSRLEMWLSLGVLLGIAPGMTALVLGATIATRWFTARRGLVLGLLGAGVATGQLVFLPPAAWLAEHYGWRAALAPCVGLIGLLAALFALLSVDRPQAVGLAPFGEPEGSAAATPPPASLPASPLGPPAGSAVALSFAALREAAQTRVFWVLAFSFGICGMTSAGLMQPHFVPMCADFGVTPVTAAGMLALMGVCDLVGTIGSGWLSDRYDNRWLLGWYYALRGLSLIWLPWSGFSLVGLGLFSVFFGLDYIATVPPSVKLAAQAFGRDKAPVVFGWIFAAHQLGAGLMAFATGLSRDLLLSYLPAFFTAGVLCLVAALSIAGIRRPARPATA